MLIEDPFKQATLVQHIRFARTCSYLIVVGRLRPPRQLYVFGIARFFAVFTVFMGLLLSESVAWETNLVYHVRIYHVRKRIRIIVFVSFCHRLALAAGPPSKLRRNFQLERYSLH